MSGKPRVAFATVEMTDEESRSAMAATAPETRAALLDGIVRWGRRLIPDRDRAERLAADLLGVTEPAADAGRENPITERDLRDVEAVCHRTARHLTL